MFWKMLGRIVVVSVGLQRTVTAIGAATIIVLGTIDYVRSRRKG